MTTAAAPNEPLRDHDPAPIPITWLNLWRWALKTGRAERRYHARLGRPTRRSPARLAASLWPSLDRAVFIVGAARSGTTFLGDCIGRLPEISYHHEPPATKAAGRYVHDELWSFRRARWFYRLVAAWLLRVELEGGLRFCDKTPTNALLIPFLDRAFPDCQVIHIIRDGRDAAASHMGKPWLRADAGASGVREPGGYLHGPWAPWWVEPERRAEFQATSDAHRMIWAWRRYTEAALRDGPPLGAGRYLELRYEQLVAQPGHESERILDFLDIREAASRAAFTDATGRVQAGSIGGWRRAFGPEELAQITADSGPLLASLGYTDG
jgi:Sulfotransferase family